MSPSQPLPRNDHVLLRPHEKPRDPKWEKLLESLPVEAREALLRDADKPTRQPQWHLVQLLLGDYPKTHTFDSVEELQEHLIATEGEDVLNFITYGEQAFISVEKPHYLILPDQRALPLFLLPSSVTPSQLGFQGDVDPGIALEGEVLDPEPAEEAAHEEEAEEDEGEDPSEKRDDMQPSDVEWTGEPVAEGEPLDDDAEAP